MTPPMIDFPPGSPWPRRIRIALICLAVLAVLQGVARMAGARWIADNGGQGIFATRIKLRSIEAVLKANYYIKHSYPSQANGLGSLYVNSRSLTGAAMKARNESPTTDFWKREFHYLIPGKHNADSYDLWSVGEDGEDGTEDDITNW
ncbi:MAG: gspG [Verrucomicrobiaceae bacterium]|nr:gspG [Verrucomicrobiaceae bacterium]